MTNKKVYYRLDCEFPNGPDGQGFTSIFEEEVRKVQEYYRFRMVPSRVVKVTEEVIE